MILTAREQSVVQIVATGDSNKLAAHALGLTYGTVKVYLTRIFKKTGASNRVRLALWAQAHPEEFPQNGPVNGPPETSLG